MRGLKCVIIRAICFMMFMSIFAIFFAQYDPVVAWRVILVVVSFNLGDIGIAIYKSEIEKINKQKIQYLEQREDKYGE